MIGTNTFARWKTGDFNVERMSLHQVRVGRLTAEGNRDLFISSAEFSLGRAVEFLHNIFRIDFTHGGYCHSEIGIKAEAAKNRSKDQRVFGRMRIALGAILN